MIVTPFRGLRPRADLVDRLPSVPYDVIDADEARELAGAEPYSFLHVIRSEVDLEPGVDPHDPRVYERAASNLRRMIDDGWLVRDEQPAFYVYRLTVGDHVQTGVVAGSAVSDYLAGSIKKHEHTRPDKEDDRVRLVEAIGAHPGPVFLTYRSLPELNATVTGVVADPPHTAVTAPDGVLHELWVVDDPTRRERIGQLFAKVPASYVADGHHRAAAAARVAASRGGGGSFLTVLFPSDQLRVLDYNRVARDLNGLEPREFVARLGRVGFDVESGHRARRPPRARCCGMYLGGTWSLLTARTALVPSDDPLARLDVSILNDHLLGPVLGIGNPRTDTRIDFVGGSRGMDELERRVGSGDWAVAFAMWPTSLDEVMQIADIGQVMPPKSTWFEPKLRPGLVVLPLDESAV